MCPKNPFAAWIALLLMLPLGSLACSGPKVQVGHDPESILARYRTYVWGGSVGATQDAIRAAAAQELPRRGLIEVPQGRPADLMLLVYAVSRNGSTYGTIPGPWRWNTPDEDLATREGSLSLSLVDRKTGDTVWRGTATDIVEQGWRDSSAERPELTRAAHDLLSHYPS